MITRIGPYRSELSSTVTLAGGFSARVTRVCYVLQVEAYCTDLTVRTSSVEISDVAAGFPAMVSEAFRRLEDSVRRAACDTSTMIIGEEMCEEACGESADEAS